MPIATLRATPFDLEWGDSVWAKVTATNVIGDSITSAEGNNAVLLTYPDAPVNLADDETVTDATTIGMTWEDGVADGGSAVVSYRIKYKETNAASYSLLAIGVTAKSYSTSSLTPGISYTFIVESRNSFGYSLSSSNELTILQA